MGAFESFGALGAFFLLAIQIPLHAVIMIRVGRLWYEILKTEKLPQFSKATAIIRIVLFLILWTILLVAVPIYTIKTYGSYSESKDRYLPTVERLKAFYEEPSYILPQVVEKYQFARVDLRSDVSLDTIYRCEINGQYRNAYWSSVSFNKKYNLRNPNPETLVIAGKKAVFDGDRALVVYDGNVIRKITREDILCEVTKENLIEIAESLRPAEYTGEDLPI